MHDLAQESSVAEFRRKPDRFRCGNSGDGEMIAVDLDHESSFLLMLTLLKSFAEFTNSANECQFIFGGKEINQAISKGTGWIFRGIHHVFIIL